MKEKQLERIETLLQIIADELYVSRTDRELSGAVGSEPAMWESEGRHYMTRGIEVMRNTVEQSRK